MDRDNPILETHPLYDAYNPAWRLYYDSWRGGLSWSADRYLYRHPREKPDEFLSRRRRTYYYNLAGPIVDIHTSNLFRPGVAREIDGGEDFLANCDRRGTSFETFMHRVSDFSKVFGHVFVLVDRPKFPTVEAPTLAMAQEMALDPFVVIILPFDVLDWETDETGTLLWVKVREKANRKLNPLMPREPDRYNYKIWTRTEWALFDENGAVLGGGQHGLGRVPVVPVYFRRTEDPVVGQSFLADIAKVCQAVFNWSSLLDQILYDQTFSILTFPDDGQVVLSERELGTARALTYPAEGSPPGFISSDASQARLLAEQIVDGVAQVHRMAMVADGGISNVSTETRRYDFAELNNSLDRQARNLQDGEESVLGIWAAWMQEEPDYSIQYPSEFSVTSLDQDLEVAAKAEAFDLGETFEAELKKRLAHKMMPQLGEDLAAKIEREIEKRARMVRELIIDKFGAEPPPGGDGSDGDGKQAA